MITEDSKPAFMAYLTFFTRGGGWLCTAFRDYAHAYKQEGDIFMEVPIKKALPEYLGGQAYQSLRIGEFIRNYVADEDLPRILAQISRSDTRALKEMILVCHSRLQTTTT